MGERIRALADPNPVDQLACLVLRVLAELSPCTERSFLEHVLGAEAASHSHTRQLAHSALLKLKALAFIEFSQEHVAITDEGRGCLRALPVVIPRQVPTADREQEGFKSSTKAKLTKLCVSSLPQLQVWLRTRHDALLRVLATTSRTQYGPWLKWFCQIRLAEFRPAMPPVYQIFHRAWGASLCEWKQKVAPALTTLLRVAMQRAKVFRRKWQVARLSEGCDGKIEAWLSNIAGVHGLLRDVKLATFGLNRSINHAGALLLVSGAIAIASGIIFLSGERANSSNAESASVSGNEAGSSRTSPIVWVDERHDRLGRSIFVTRRLAGATWIEGLAITGENASKQMLTGVQGTIKMDSGEEIKLSVSTEGSQGKWADAQDVSPGSKFALKSALTRDNAQTEMPAEEFLSKHGGMIFRVSYAIGGVQTTVIEYFSVSKLRAQLADMS